MSDNEPLTPAQIRALGKLRWWQLPIVTRAMRPRSPAGRSAAAGGLTVALVAYLRSRGWLP